MSSIHFTTTGASPAFHFWHIKQHSAINQVQKENCYIIFVIVLCISPSVAVINVKMIKEAFMSRVCHIL
jgi:hypothetical protein